MNNFISNHTINTRNSYWNKSQVEKYPVYQLIFDPSLCLHQQYTPINTRTLYQLPRPQYWTVFYLQDCFYRWYI